MTSDNPNDPGFDNSPPGFGGGDSGYIEGGEKPKKSLFVKLLIVFGILGGIGCCGCCGFGFYMVQGMQPNEDPVATLALGEEILKSPVSEDLFTPQATMDISFFSFFEMKMAIFSAAKGEGQLMLIKMKFPQQPGQEQDIEQALKQQTGQGGSKNLIIESSESRTINVKNVGEIEFQFSKAKEASSSTAYRQIQGVLPSPGGGAMFLLQVEESAYDEPAIISWLTGEAAAAVPEGVVPDGNQDAADDGEPEGGDNRGENGEDNAVDDNAGTDDADTDSADPGNGDIPVKAEGDTPDENADEEPKGSPDGEDSPDGGDSKEGGETQADEKKTAA